METANSLYSGILLLGAAHGVFLALAILNVKSGNITALRLLALITVTFAADLGVDFLKESRYLVEFPRVIFIEAITSFLYGPLTYLYVCALTSQSTFRLSFAKLAHFLPLAASIVLLVPFYFVSDDKLLASIYSDADVDPGIGLWALGGLFIFVFPIPQIATYFALSIRRLIRHGRSIREQFSSIQKISLVWLRNLLAAFCVLYILYFIGTVFSGAFISNENLERLLNLATVIVIYSIGYMGLRQPQIFSQDGDDVVTDSTTVVAGKKKYQRSALDAETSGLLLKELESYMARERPYLDNTLTMSQLASQLGISSNYLSQIINEQTGKNFFDFVNSYRVGMAKQLLATSPDSRTNILTIAMESGFNSKSAFYDAFRQHAMMTPGQYRKSLAAAPE